MTSLKPKCLEWILICRVAIAALLISALSTVVVPRQVAADEPLDDLEAEIEADLKNDRWSQESRAVVRLLWKEYKRAHLDGKTEINSWSAAHGQKRDAEDFDLYVGKYGRSVDGPAGMEVTRDDHGRYFVKADNHVIPAVPTAQAILFTTGDVVFAPSIPRLTKKGHASLEYFEIVRVNGEFYMSNTGVGDVEGRGRRLYKSDGKRRSTGNAGS